MSTQTSSEWIFILTLFIVAKKLETSEIYIKWWMDEQTVVHSYDGILLSNIKKWITDTHCNTDDSQMHYVK